MQVYDWFGIKIINYVSHPLVIQLFGYLFIFFIFQIIIGFFFLHFTYFHSSRHECLYRSLAFSFLSLSSVICSSGNEACDDFSFYLVIIHNSISFLCFFLPGFIFVFHDILGLYSFPLFPFCFSLRSLKYTSFLLRYFFFHHTYFVNFSMFPHCPSLAPSYLVFSSLPYDLQFYIQRKFSRRKFPGISSVYRPVDIFHGLHLKKIILQAIIEHFQQIESMPGKDIQTPKHAAL